MVNDESPALQKRCIRFISKCLSSSNSIVNLISHLYIAITNSLSSDGKKNYRSVIDADCELNNSYSTKIIGIIHAKK